MGTASRTTSGGGLAQNLRAKAAYAFLIVPAIGIGVLFWKATHALVKPDISIYRAAERGDFDSVRAHVLTGTPVNSLSSDGHSPLFYAVLGRDADIVDLLLENGALPSAEARGQTTPLAVAARQGDVDIVKALIAAGADPKDQRSKTPTIFAAADSGKPEILKIFLENGADPNAPMQNNTKGTPLCNAAIKGNLECVKLLIQHGADINGLGFDGRSAIRYAVQSGHYEVVKYLIEKGCDPDTRDGHGVFPLSTAFQIQADEKLTWLLLNNMDDFRSLDWHAKSPLHYASEGGTTPEMIKALIGKGMDPNQPDSVGYTPLMWAFDKKRFEVQDALLANGARITLRQMIREALEPPRPNNPGPMGNQ